MLNDVFISCSHLNEYFAEQLEKALTDVGLQVKLSLDNASNAATPDNLRLMIVVVSSPALRSPVVQAQIEAASNAGLPIIAAQIGGIKARPDTLNKALWVDERKNQSDENLAAIVAATKAQLELIKAGAEKHDVFISYSTKDLEIAEKIRKKFEENGVQCWIASRDIPTGGSYPTEIVSAVNGCKILFLVFSSNANKSPHCVNEVSIAFDNKKMIMPLRIENVQPTGEMAYFLKHSQWKDALASSVESHFDSLLEAIYKFLPHLRKAGSTEQTPVVDSSNFTSEVINNKANGDLNSALMSQGRYKATAVLNAIRAGATNFTLTDQKGRTALYWAVRQGDADAVQIALNNGAQADARDTDGETPLDVAQTNGFAEIVALLAPNAQPRKSGVTPAPSRNNAQSPASRATTKANEQLKSAMMSQGRYKAGMILSAIHGGATDFSPKDQKGRTALWWAVRESDAEAVQIALNNGARPDARGDDGETPLDLARANGLAEIVALLAPNDKSLKPKTTAISPVPSNKQVPSLEASVAPLAKRTFDVFVSHSSKDRSQAELLWKALEKQGHKCWIAPESILPSEQWPDAIRRGVSQSKILVLLFSANSDQSDEVQTEIYYAKKKFDVPVVPIRIQDVEPERLEHFIWNAQWISAIEPTLGQQLGNVVAQIEKVLQQQPVGIDPTPKVTIAEPSATVQEGENWYSIDEKLRVFSKKASDTTVNLLRALAKISDQMLPEIEKELNAQVSNRKAVKEPRPFEDSAFVTCPHGTNAFKIVAGGNDRQAKKDRCKDGQSAAEQRFKQQRKQWQEFVSEKEVKWHDKYDSLPAEWGQKSPYLEAVRQAFYRCDALASELQGQVKRAYFLILALSLAVTVNVSIAVTWSQSVISTALLVLTWAFLLGAAWIVKREKNSGRDTRYQDYRALAEAFRVLFFWRAAGITEPLDVFYLRAQRSELGFAVPCAWPICNGAPALAGPLPTNARCRWWARNGFKISMAISLAGFPKTANN